MQKKTAKKLVLRKETVLRLEELKDVQGGISDTCICSFTCTALCPRRRDDNTNTTL